MMDEILNYERKENEDLYKILGCDELSTIEQITAEYKARVLDCHPDKHPGDKLAAERFSNLQRAKEILTDSETRSKYDAWRGSGIAMSFDQWLGLRNAVHTSMHWASIKKQPMIEHETTHYDGICNTLPMTGLDTTQYDDICHNQISHSNTSTNQSQHTKDNTCYGRILWQRDPASETLRKFRNYEI